MNIENLLSQIEDILEAGSKVPLSNKTGVDAGAIRTIIEDIRVNLPNEITQARAIVADRNNILIKAKDEAVNAVTGAQEKSRALISTAEDKVRALVLKTEDYSKNKLAEAEAQAKQIVNTANEDAKIIKANVKVG
jgi:vacuolar-type H+-ATPase subunit H